MDNIFRESVGLEILKETMKTTLKAQHETVFSSEMIQFLGSTKKKQLAGKPFLEEATNRTTNADFPLIRYFVD